MKALGLVAVMAGTAAADPCKAEGKVVVTVDQHAPKSSATTTLFAGGAWQREIRGEGAKKQAGCVPASQLGRIRFALRENPWRVTARSLCPVDTGRVRRYIANGKTLVSLSTCDQLDDISRSAIDMVDWNLVIADNPAHSVNVQPIVTTCCFGTCAE